MPLPVPPPITAMPRGVLTLGQLALQRLQLQILGGPGQLADLPVLLVHEVDGDGLAGDQQGHQDGQRGQGGSAPEGRPAGHRGGTRSRSRCAFPNPFPMPNGGALWSPLSPNPPQIPLRGARSHPDKCNHPPGHGWVLHERFGCARVAATHRELKPRWGHVGAATGLGCLGYSPTWGREAARSLAGARGQKTRPDLFLV